MYVYGQVARVAEIVADRWTPLTVRSLRHFQHRPEASWMSRGLLPERAAVGRATVRASG
jgi:hypothetical protein